MGAEVPRRVSAAARRGARAVQQRRRARRRDRRHHRGGDRRSVQGESGVNIGDRRIPARGAASLPRARRAADRRRDPDRLRPHRHAGLRFEHAGIEPDIVCLAKGLGGGFPMGALAYTTAVRDALYQGAHGSTFGGSPLACAAGLAALAAYRDEASIERSATAGRADAVGAARGARRRADGARGSRARA